MAKYKLVYIVTSRFKNRDDFTTVAIDRLGFTNMDDAIVYCLSKLTFEEQENHKKQLARRLISWYEFDSKDYYYEIHMVNIQI